VRLKEMLLHRKENEKELKISTVSCWRVEKRRRFFDVIGRNMRYVSKLAHRL